MCEIDPRSAHAWRRAARQTPVQSLIVTTGTPGRVATRRNATHAVTDLHDDAHSPKQYGAALLPEAVLAQYVPGDGRADGIRLPGELLTLVKNSSDSS